MYQLCFNFPGWKINHASTNLVSGSKREGTILHAAQNWSAGEKNSCTFSSLGRKALVLPDLSSNIEEYFKNVLDFSTENFGEYCIQEGR